MTNSTDGPPPKGSDFLTTRGPDEITFLTGSGAFDTVALTVSRLGLSQSHVSATSLRAGRGVGVPSGPQRGQGASR
jgi:hypothetical protein